MKRREFVYTSAVLAGLRYLPNSKATLKPTVKISCNFYSFNQLISEGSWSLEKAIDFCSDLGFDGVDITGYYFSGYPKVPSDEYIYAIKNRVLRHGMHVSGTGVRNDFAQGDRKAVDEDLQLVKEWIQVAAKLGAPMIRVFAGRKLSEARVREEAIQQVVECLQECIRYGASKGVIVTLQNHNDIFFTADELIPVLDELESPWFGINLDIGSLRRGDPYEEIKKLVPYARNWQIKEYVYRQGEKEPVDLQKLGRVIIEGDYRGYLPLETLPPSDPRLVLPEFLRGMQDALN